MPEIVTLEITADTVVKVTNDMPVAAGPGGIYSLAIQHWLLRFGVNSNKLREAVVHFLRWMDNRTSPWAAYRAIVAIRLIGLDKYPGVRPVGIREVWQRLFAKIVSVIAGEEAKKEYGDDQLCAGL